MDYVITLPEQEKRRIERQVRNTDLMPQDMGEAVRELTKVTAIIKAIKIIKLKNRKR